MHVMSRLSPILTKYHTNIFDVGEHLRSQQKQKQKRKVRFIKPVRNIQIRIKFRRW